MQKAVATKRKKEIVDITERVHEWIKEAGGKEGICTLFILHTTAALTTADLDPGTDLDMLDAFEAMVPKLSYRHPHDPSHTGDHIMASLIGASLSLPYGESGLLLGAWQRVVLVEMDGPRERQIVCSVG